MVTIDTIVIKHFGMCTKKLRGNVILATKMRIAKNMKTISEGNNQGKARPKGFGQSNLFL